MLRKVTFVCVGSLKKIYLRELERLYSRGLHLVVIKDSYIDVECDKILGFINSLSDTFCVLFDINGDPGYKFRNILVENFSMGKNVIFIVGGSNGVNKQVRNVCDLKLKLSNLTYSHQIFRICSMIFIRDILL